ncbi:hypothetical protein V6Z11_D05G318000 [Gossypium hirsutum]
MPNQKKSISIFSKSSIHFFRETFPDFNEALSATPLNYHYTASLTVHFFSTHFPCLSFGFFQIRSILQDSSNQADAT